MKFDLRKRLTLPLAVALVAGMLLAGHAVAGNLTPKEELGSLLYFDEDLSQPNGQSCASCHEPSAGFADPDVDLPVSQGVLSRRVGNRNSPASSYAMYAPIRYFDEGEGLWIGGQFWDGRATGEVLGDPLADQALGPFLNPLEMHNRSKRTVIRDIRRSDYRQLFRAVWGSNSLWWRNFETAYDQVALSIAAFERSQLFGQFSSAYDAYLAACLADGGAPAACADGSYYAGEVSDPTGILSDEAWAGLQLWMNGENDNDGTLELGEGAACVLCHVADWTEAASYDLPVQVPDWAPDGMVPPLFTDFTFDNLGVPKNWDNPFLYLPRKLNPDGADYVDLGLGDNLKELGYPMDPDPDNGVLGYGPELGKFKVMTTRNVGLNPPYAHNGIFGSLEEIVHFYNTRDVPGEGWDAPEYGDTMNTEELGNLGLSPAEEQALVAFMEALSDQ